MATLEKETTKPPPTRTDNSFGSLIIIGLAILVYAYYASSNGGAAAILKPLETTITNVKALAGDKASEKKLNKSLSKARSESDKAGATNPATKSNYRFVTLASDWSLKGPEECDALEGPVTAAGKHENVDPRLLMSLAKYESDCNHTNRVACGGTMTRSFKFNPGLDGKGRPYGYAIGPTQLLKDTAVEQKVHICNLAENLIGGARYLHKKIKSYGGDLYLALSSYNGGTDPRNAAAGYATNIMKIFRGYGGKVQSS